MSQGLPSPPKGLRAVHPDETLREPYLKSLGMSSDALATALKVPTSRIHDFLLKRHSVTVETAIRLTRYFCSEVRTWMNLQVAWTFKMERHKPLNENCRVSNCWCI